MKMKFSQIKEAVSGAVRITEDADGIRFYRFTEEQEQIYKGYNTSFYNKTFCTAGVKMCFRTDSRTMKFCADTERSTTREYHSFDIFVNGQQVSFLSNFDEEEMTGKYVGKEFPAAVSFSELIELGEGEKTVTVYFPWSAKVCLKELSLDDGASFEGVKPKKKLLAFGDSITHGYDALHPSNRYISKLAEALDAEEINKAIGGEIFWPSLAQTKDDFCPDYITVAYGTNDWSHQTEESFKATCKAFYTALRSNYPSAKIFALAPIWRKDYTETREFGPFENITKYIKEATDDIPDVTFISCFDFVPGEEKYFADLRLHPNDAGFEYYAENVIRAIKEVL